MRSTKLLLFAVPTVAVLGLGAWLTGPCVHAWYVFRGLRSADDAARPAWAAAVARVGEPAVEPLLAGLDGPHADAFAAGLEKLPDAVAPAVLADRLVKAFPRLTPAAHPRALETMIGWMERCDDDEMHRRAADLLPLCANQPECLEASVGLAAAVMARSRPADVTAACRQLARAGLESADAAARVRAVTLCLQPGMDLMTTVTPLRKDPSPEVRRAALVAVGPDPDLIHEEELLTHLHDADESVRGVARSSLLARGLRPEQIELGRLLTHPTARGRLEVLDRLPEVTDVDPGVWLRRLSQDGSPAVRAAAARAMGPDHLDRLEQMARSDPSPTVAYVARYYLGQRSRLRTVGGP